MTSTLITFDSGTVGSNIVGGSDGIQSVVDTGNPPKFDTGFHGTAQVHAGSPTNTANSRFRVDLGVSGDHFGSIYLKDNTPHTTVGSFQTFVIFSDSVNFSSVLLRAGSNRELNIRVGTNNVVRTGSSGDIPSNAEFRFDWQVTGTTINWRLFYDPEASSSSTPDLSGSIDFSTASTSISRLVLGPNSSDAITNDWNYDTIRAQDTGTWFDAFNPPVTDSGPKYSVWNGTAEVPATMKVWNGSAEVDVTQPRIQFAAPDFKNDGNGTSGTTVSTANSPAGNNQWDQVNGISAGGTVAYDSTHQLHGKNAIKIQTAGGSGSLACVRWSTSIGSKSGRIFGEMYVYLGAYPAAGVTAGWRLMSLDKDASNCCSIHILPDGTIDLRNSAAAVVLHSTTVVPLNQWVRIEWFVSGDSSSGQAWMALHVTDPDGLIPDWEDISTASQAFTGPPNTYVYGIETTTVNAGPYWIAAMRQSMNGPIGPAS